jgi:hypothetical protein
VQNLIVLPVPLLCESVAAADTHIFRESLAALQEAHMITLTIILLIVFVPPFRRALSRMVWGVFAAVGIVFLIAPRSRPRSKGF